MTSSTANPKLCLPLEFRSLLKGTGFGSQAAEAIFRFASVKLNAKFDPSCMRERCLDRGTVLQDVEVVDALERRKSRLGLWLGQRTSLVTLSDAEDKLIIAAAYRAGFPEGLSHQEKDATLAALMRPYDPLVKAFGIQGKTDDAVVCWVSAGLGDDVWPDSLEGALSAPSIEDHYQCNQVRRMEGEWVVQVNAHRLAPNNL